MMIRNIILIDDHDKLLNLETVQPQVIRRPPRAHCALLEGCSPYT